MSNEKVLEKIPGISFSSTYSGRTCSFQNPLATENNLHGNQPPNLEKGEQHFTIEAHFCGCHLTTKMDAHRVTTHKGCNPLIHVVAVCEENNATWKRDMEDVTIILENYGGNAGATFFGVFDGFHGRSAAMTTSSELPLLVLEQLSNLDPSLSMETNQKDLLSRFDFLFRTDSQPYSGPAPHTIQRSDGNQKDLKQALTTAFTKMDRILSLGRNETSRIRWSGCTALVCLIVSDAFSDEKVGIRQNSNASGSDSLSTQKSPSGRIILANCGDVHAVLYKQGKAFRLTKDHSTSNSKERKRITKNGGFISANKQHGFVEGLTKATRGLGHHGDHQLKKAIIPVPYCVSLINDPSFQLLILASSGLLDVLNDDIVANTIKTVLESTQESLMPKASMVFQPCVSPSGEKFGQAEHAAAAREQQSSKSEKDIAALDILKDENEIKDVEGIQNLNQQSAFPQKDSERSESTLLSSSVNRTVNYECFAIAISRALVDAALVSGSKENISVTVILLQGSNDIIENIHRK